MKTTGIQDEAEKGKLESDEELNAKESTTNENGTCSIIDIEIRFKKARNASAANSEALISELTSFVESLEEIYNARSIKIDEANLAEKIDRIVVSSAKLPDGCKLPLHEINVAAAKIHTYTARNFSAMPQDLSLDGQSEGASVGSHHYEMPCQEFDDLWETLIYDDNIKNELLSYAFALLRLSDSGANTTILSINRIILLHGPPGTGKTSLCKALAQRLSIRLGFRYKRSVFIEINSHSLFSKWFSESGKLIGKLFDEIQELATDSKLLIFVLIDEVESLTMGRNAAFSGADPSDSVRAVNAVLTQLDKIKKFPNVLVLATSNISAALDSAFMDRTDICRMVGNPSSIAAYHILSSATAELQRIGAVDDSVKLASTFSSQEQRNSQLNLLSEKCVGLSGRSIRKLPVLAFSKSTTDKPDLSQFLDLLSEAIDEMTISAKQKTL